MDCIHVKVRDRGAVRVNLHSVIGVSLDGLKGFPGAIEAVCVPQDLRAPMLGSHGAPQPELRGL
jgi:hypothetical protein